MSEVRGADPPTTWDTTLDVPDELLEQFIADARQLGQRGERSMLDFCEQVLAQKVAR